MKTELHHFCFSFKGHGHYEVAYRSPSTNKTWIKVITDMEIIDATKNNLYAKRVDLNKLKRLCKAEN